MTNKTNYTNDQLEAINAGGENIIVSAGAGSGKTAVLSERVFRLVSSEKIDIDHLLVLTFTNAASKEMKDRIRKKLLVNEGNLLNEDELKRQLNKIDSSYIMTFDAYALSLVKKYHQELNIDRNVNIIDENIISLKINEIINELLLEEYRSNNPKFIKLINELCIKDDNNIKEAIKNIYYKLSLIYDLDNYLDNYEENNYSNNALDKLINDYTDLLINKINGINNLLIKFKGEVNDYRYYYPFIDDLISSKTYEDIRNVLLSFDKIPPIKKDDSSIDSKALKEAITAALKKLIELVNPSKEELINNVLLSRNNCLVLIDLSRKLINRLNVYKRNNNLYEYNDIFKLAIDLVNTNDDIRNEIRDYFKEILIDEYQDTSDLQDLFISLISNNNVYMVGDIKQSIYQFRNANPKLFLDKYNRYSNNDGGRAINLRDNFRSRQEVLEGINKVFDRIMDENIGGASYKEKHHMLSSRIEYKNIFKTNQDNSIEILNYQYNSISRKEYPLKDYSKAEIEAFTIGTDIINKINNGYLVADKALRNATYKDFTILVDRSTDFDTYKEILTYLNIPTTIISEEKMDDSDLLTVIKSIFAYLSCIHNDDYGTNFKKAYISLARSFILEIKDNEIHKTFKDNSFIDTNLHKTTLKIYEDIDYKTITNILDEIIKEFDIYQKIYKIGDVEANYIKIDYLYKLACNLNDLGYSYLDFNDFLIEIFDLDNTIRFNIERNDENAVKIMSIHKSKGLEFPICYYPSLTKKFNEEDIKERITFSKDLGIIIPVYIEGYGLEDTIKKELFKYKYLKEDIAEKIRLFYVALTRAKEKIIMVSPIEDRSSNDTNIVSDNDRLSINSFSDILELIYNDLSIYNTSIDFNKINLSFDYKYPKLSIFNKLTKEGNLIQVKEGKSINKTLIENTNYSKDSGLINTELLEKMRFGSQLHYELETIDFNKPDYSFVDNKHIKIISSFLSSDLLKNKANAKIYKEYEFIDNGNIGIIDLMMEYDDHIDIIDYKTKNIDDEAYFKQLKGYKEYISSICDLPINCYLYSLIDCKYIKVD